MDSGLYSAYSGLRVNADILEVLSNNLANANTTAFKSDQAFLRIYNHAVADSSISMDRVLNDSSFVEGSAINFVAGPIKPTGRDLDVALEGPGFFALEGPTGSFFTRNGSFRLDAAGHLTNSEGFAVLGTKGPIQLPEGKISISKDGGIQVGDSVIDKLQIVGFAKESLLEKVGNSLFRVPSGQNIQPAKSDTTVVQGSLEQSNVNPVREMMLMISVMRQFEGLQKAIYTLMNTVDDRSINQLGRVVE